MSNRRSKLRLISALLACAMIGPVIPTMTPATSYAEVKKADWSIDDKKEADMNYWKVPNSSRVKVVANAEGIKTPSVNYIGTYVNEDGRTVIRISYRAFQNLASGVWNRALFKFDNDLYDLIDFDSKNTGMYKNAVDRGWHDSEKYNEIVQFTDVVSSISGAVNVKEQSLKNNGNKVLANSRLEIPIDLVLKEGKTVGDIKGQPHIQMRFTDNKYDRIFCVAGTGKSKDNPENTDDEEADTSTIMTPYNSYTFMTYIPSANNNADVNTVSDYNMDYQFYSANSYAKYNEAGGYLDVFHKQSKLASGDNIGGENFAFRQVFNEKFANVLKAKDESGTVAEVFPANQQGDKWSNVSPIYISKDDINTSDNSDLNPGFYGIQVASKYKNSTIGEKFAGLNTVLTKANPGNSYLNTATTEFNSGLPTITRYYIDKDKIASEGLTTDDIASFDFYSTFILDSTREFIEYSATNDTGSDIILKPKSTLKLTYADNGTSNPRFGLDKYSLTFGDGPYKIELRSNFKYEGNGGKEYEYNLVPGMTIKAGEKITFRTMKYNTPPSKVTLSLPGTDGNEDIVLKPGENGPKVKTARRLNYITTYAGGSATQTGLTPDIDEIFTDSSNITGRTNYDLAKIKLTLPDEKRFVFINKEQKDRTKMNVNGAEVFGYTFTTGGKNGFAMPDNLQKDTPIRIANEDVKKAAIESEGVIEQVQAKVRFDLNGGRLDPSVKSFKGLDDTQLPGTEFAYKTARDSGNEEVVRIAPMNVKYATDSDYIANGFEGDNVSLKDHNGNDLEGEALELRKFVAEKPSVEGKIFLGWTTKALKGTQEQVTKDFAELTEATTADEVNSDKNYIFTKTSPVTKETTVYAAYGSPMVKFHTNPPAELTDKTDEVINQSLTDQNITDSAVTLQKNYEDGKFQMEGYSLIGYSTDKNAKIPDENLTGTEITTDKYLRDGDKMRLSKDQVNKGLDLYAIWRPNHYVVVTSEWDPAELESKTKDKLYIGLLTRPAVGVAGKEVVHEDAVYRPVPGTVKAVSDAIDNSLTWDNLPSYDENGHRMSYITVELTESTKKIFESGSTNYSDYGITIESKAIGERKIKVKKQLVNTDGVDAMSAATERKHYKEDKTKIDVHQPGSKIGYFDTYGYYIELKNTKVNVQPPIIDPVEHGANKVVVKKVGDPSKLTVTLPGEKKVILVKNAEGEFEKDSTTDFTGNVEITSEGIVTITLPEGEIFEGGQAIEALQTKNIGNNGVDSTISKTVVKAQPKSHKVVSYEQKPNDDKGNAVVEFTVPRHPLLPPKAGSKYTIGYMNVDTFVPVAPEYVLNEDILSDSDTEKKASFTIPKEKFEEIEDKNLIIKSEEKGKLPNESEKISVDTTAPTATATAEDELWRRWVNLDLSNFDEANEIIVVKYKDAQGQEHVLRFNTKDDSEGAVNMLERQGFSEYEVTLEDRFGNENIIRPEYNPSLITVISVSRFRLNKDYVQVRANDAGTTVTVRVYKPSDLNDVEEMIEGYQARAISIGQATIDQAGGKFTKIKLDNNYKIKKGDVIEVKGVVDATGARTNPYVRIVR